MGFFVEAKNTFAYQIQEAAALGEDPNWLQRREAVAQYWEEEANKSPVLKDMIRHYAAIARAAPNQTYYELNAAEWRRQHSGSSLQDALIPNELNELVPVIATVAVGAGFGYAAYSLAAPTVASGASGEIAAATGAEVVGAYGGMDTAAVASASYATPGAVAGAASVYGGTESLVYGGFDAGADYAAATVPSNLASAPSVIDQIKSGANLFDRLYSTGSKIYNLFTGGRGSAPASAPLNGYAPELVNPLSTGGLFGSIYPGEYAGGPLSGFGTGGDKGGTIADFLKSSSGLAMFIGIGLLIAGLILFMRR